MFVITKKIEKKQNSILLELDTRVYVRCRRGRHLIRFFL